MTIKTIPLKFSEKMALSTKTLHPLKLKTSK